MVVSRTITPQIAARARQGLIVRDEAPDPIIRQIRWKILLKEKRERAAAAPQVAA